MIVAATATRARRGDAAPQRPEPQPTLWGLSVPDLHDRYWTARGVQVVRPGAARASLERAHLYLLLAADTLCLFRLRPLVVDLSWVSPELMWIRIRDERDAGYRERVLVDEQGNFDRFARSYGERDARLARVALTPSRSVAEKFRSATSASAGWRRLRADVPRPRRWCHAVRGNTYDIRHTDEAARFTRDLTELWPQPDASITRIRHVGGNVWADREADVSERADFIGSVWVGAGRQINQRDSLLGPAVLWDDPKHSPDADVVDWDDLEPSQSLSTPEVKPRSRSRISRGIKRGFDVAFALTAILLTLPIYPLVMLAIWLEDGRPFFFAHQRETRGGRTFPCLKFRSMRKDAEQIKAQLIEQNQADGPQFFMEHDPRLTRVGRFIRATQIDELPQFFNVLAGHMSIVGPRPSPYKENQYCPAWREARLSVPPGITGLWQVKRTRATGNDFQEWIRYDLEYVERNSLCLDIWIIWRTVVQMVRRD
jgi:lipopolysaccharide/colanic/teichoic acid biosynthesis glycosyltransferase